MTRAQQTLKRELKILRAIKRLERQGVVEVKKDIALFGGVYKRGIKILITI